MRFNGLFTVCSDWVEERLSATLTFRFVHDVSGSIAVTFALMSIVLIGFTGAVVDYAFWRNLQEKAQAAADSSALAAAISEAEEPADLRRVVSGFGLAHADGEFDLHEIIYNPDNEQVSVTLTGLYDTLFLPLFGINTLPIRALAAAERGSRGKLEVALVLDNTWSMSELDPSGYSKIDVLKKAASSLVRDLVASGGENVRIALVPYADYVNVGVNNRYASWIDVPTDYSTTAPKLCVPSVLKTQCRRDISAKICSRYVDGVLEKFDCTPNICTTVTVPQYQSCTGGQTTRWTWFGCVLSRNYQQLRLNDHSPSIRFKGFLDTFKKCVNPVVPLTIKFENILNNIASMIVTTGPYYRPLTYIPAGMIWGINVLSPTEPFAEGEEYDIDRQNPRKVLVLMTDGDNTLRFDAATGRHYGLAIDSNQSQKQKTQTDADTLNLCNFAKGQGIEVFTVAFGVLLKSSKDLLAACASGSSNFFSARNAEELSDAFQKIGSAMELVRIVK